MTFTIPEILIGFVLGVVATIVFAVVYTTYFYGKRK